MTANRRRRKDGRSCVVHMPLCLAIYASSRVSLTHYLCAGYGQHTRWRSRDEGAVTLATSSARGGRTTRAHNLLAFYTSHSRVLSANGDHQTLANDAWYLAQNGRDGYREQRRMGRDDLHRRGGISPFTSTAASRLRATPPALLWRGVFNRIHAASL